MGCRGCPYFPFPRPDTQNTQPPRPPRAGSGQLSIIVVVVIRESSRLSRPGKARESGASFPQDKGPSCEVAGYVEQCGGSQLPMSAQAEMLPGHDTVCKRGASLAVKVLSPNPTINRPKTAAPPSGPPLVQEAL